MTSRRSDRNASTRTDRELSLAGLIGSPKKPYWTRWRPASGRRADIVRRNNYGPSWLMLSVSVGWVCRRNRSVSVTSPFAPPPPPLPPWHGRRRCGYQWLHSLGPTSKPDAADMQSLTFVDALMVELKRVSLKMIAPFNWVCSQG